MALPRLLIVVPYRDREAHLRQFIEHVRAYFARDKVDRLIDYRVLVVEQEAGLPFNLGLVRNAGFVLGQETSDYTCFHDVDYLPVWTEYAWCDDPTPLAWHGAEVRPIAPGETTVVVKNELDSFFGAVLLIPNARFREVNGYSNEYWGWGYEDTDLRERFLRARVPLGRRRGTYYPLSHRNAGHELDGAPSAAAQANRALFARKQAAGDSDNDGLSTLAFEVLRRKPIPHSLAEERNGNWEQVLIRPGLQPSPAQLAASRGIAPARMPG